MALFGVAGGQEEPRISVEPGLGYTHEAGFHWMFVGQSVSDNKSSHSGILTLHVHVRRVPKQREHLMTGATVYGMSNLSCELDG